MFTPSLRLFPQAKHRQAWQLWEFYNGDRDALLVTSRTGSAVASIEFDAPPTSERDYRSDALDYASIVRRDHVVFFGPGYRRLPLAPRGVYVRDLRSIGGQFHRLPIMLQHGVRMRPVDTRGRLQVTGKDYDAGLYRNGPNGVYEFCFALKKKRPPEISEAAMSGITSGEQRCLAAVA